MNNNQFILEFEKLLVTRFGITLNDVSEEVVLGCNDDGWTPEETVEWLERKYDLDDLNSYIFRG